MSETS